MSHELRTPPSAIIGFAALMRDEPLDGDRRSVPDEWIQHVYRSGDHLPALIHDVLGLTKSRAHRAAARALRLGGRAGRVCRGPAALADH
jgi:signal transduction histidine kinase